jgi:hypothetical protein
MLLFPDSRLGTRQASCCNGSGTAQAVRLCNQIQRTGGLAPCRYQLGQQR